MFEGDGGGHIAAKKMAGYNQFRAVQVAVGETVRAAEFARADREGTLAGFLKSDLRPADDPIAAFDAFLDGAGVPRLLDLSGVLYWETGMVLPARGVDAEHILLQALRLALGALPPRVRSGYEAELGDWPRSVLIYRGRAWRAIAESVRERGLRWDAGEARYVAD